MAPKFTTGSVQPRMANAGIGYEHCKEDVMCRSLEIEWHVRRGV